MDKRSDQLSDKKVCIKIKHYISSGDKRLIFILLKKSRIVRTSFNYKKTEEG